MSGAEVIAAYSRYLRELKVEDDDCFEVFNAIHIIGLAKNPSEEDLKLAYSCGMRYCLGKPEADDDLLAAVIEKVIELECEELNDKDPNPQENVARNESQKTFFENVIPPSFLSVLKRRSPSSESKNLLKPSHSGKVNSIRLSLRKGSSILTSLFQSKKILINANEDVISGNNKVEDEDLNKIVIKSIDDEIVVGIEVMNINKMSIDVENDEKKKSSDLKNQLHKTVSSSA